MLTEDKEVAPSNALVPISVTPFGIEIDVNPLALWKVYRRMFVTPLGIAIEIRWVFSWKAPSPIEVTDSGIEIDVNLVDWKA